MSDFNCLDRRKSGIFNRPMALIAIMLLVLMAQALAADRASGRASQATGGADG